MDSDKENEGSPVPQHKKRPISAITRSPAIASSTRKDSDGETRLPLTAPMRIRESNREGSRPTKVRRLSEDVFQVNKDVISSKDKGKSREVQNEFATPVATRTNDPKRIEDYSAFKGRGRYGKSAKSNQCVIRFYPWFGLSHFQAWRDNDQCTIHYRSYSK